LTSNGQWLRPRDQRNRHQRKKIAGEGFKRAWPPLIKMDEAVKTKIDSLFNNK
jgi:hypothetical protein